MSVFYARRDHLLAESAARPCGYQWAGWPAARRAVSFRYNPDEDSIDVGGTALSDARSTATFSETRALPSWSMIWRQSILAAADDRRSAAKRTFCRLAVRHRARLRSTHIPAFGPGGSSASVSTGIIPFSSNARSVS